MGVVFLLRGRVGQLLRAALAVVVFVLGLAAGGGTAVVLVAVAVVFGISAAMTFDGSGSLFESPWRERDEPHDRRY